MIDCTRLRNLLPLLIVETEEVFETLLLSQLDIADFPRMI
jgi:hypothetical protein